MSEAVTGAVNGIATEAVVATVPTNPVTIPYFPGGTTTTLGVDTDGTGTHGTNHRVAVICGNTSGRDHFPFAVPDWGVLPPDEPPYRVGTDLATVMKWLWRVKKWDLRGTFGWTGGLGAYSITFVSPAHLALYWNAASPVHPTVENQLVNFGMFANDSMDITFTKPVGSGDLILDAQSCILLDNTDPDYPPIIFDPDVADRFHPKFGFDVLVAGAGDPSNLDGIEIDSNGFDVFGEEAGSITIDGVETTLYVSSAGADVVPGSISCDLTLTPSEYWPYANTSAASVYDTSTGAQLVDPLS